MVAGYLSASEKSGVAEFHPRPSGGDTADSMGNDASAAAARL